jgi:hypothetical protein
MTGKTSRTGETKVDDGSSIPRTPAARLTDGSDVVAGSSAQ